MKSFDFYIFFAIVILIGKEASLLIARFTQNKINCWFSKFDPKMTHFNEKFLKNTNLKFFQISFKVNKSQFLEFTSLKVITTQNSVSAHEIY